MFLLDAKGNLNSLFTLITNINILNYFDFAKTGNRIR